MNQTDILTIHLDIVYNIMLNFYFFNLLISKDITDMMCNAAYNKKTKQRKTMNLLRKIRT